MTPTQTAVEQPTDTTDTLFSGKTAPRLFAETAIDHGRIPVDLCDRGRFQPRQDFPEQELQELANSLVQTGGNIQPVILRKKRNQRYEILAGERRIRATMLAGMDSVLAVFGDFTDHQCQIITVVENLQRSDLNPIEEAQGFQSLLDSGLKQQEVAVSVGKSRVFVANSVRLLKLDIGVRDLLRANKLSQGHGKAIAGLKPELKHRERELAQRAVRGEWTVRRLEAEVTALNGAQKVRLPTTRNVNLRRLEELASGKFGAPVAIRPSSKTAGGGFIHIPYTSEAEMRTLLEKMGAWPDVDERD